MNTDVSTRAAELAESCSVTSSCFQGKLLRFGDLTQELSAVNHPNGEKLHVHPFSRVQRLMPL